MFVVQIVQMSNFEIIVHVHSVHTGQRLNGNSLYRGHQFILIQFKN